MRSIICGTDCNRIRKFFPVQIEAYGAAAIQGVEKIDSVDAGMLNRYCHVEPLASLGPAYIELTLGRRHQVVRTVVKIWCWNFV